MMMPFVQLQHHIKRMISTIVDSNLTFALNNINKFVQKAVELNLGHLCFHRSIPTLSGGELQRLRMVQVLNTQLSNLLLVLDEPLAGLSGREKASVYNCITALSEKHTVVVVDHSDVFADSARIIIALGEKGGSLGGHLIDANSYLEKQRIVNKMEVAPAKENIHVLINNSIYAYSGVDIKIGKGCLNLITGHSGVGKSTHTAFWNTLFQTPYLNGDLNLLGFDIKKKQMMVYGIPWCGTSGIFTAQNYELGGIILLGQHPSKNHFEDLNESEQILRVMQRMISPAWKEQQLSLNLMFAEEIVSRVPVFSFLCMPQPSSAQSLKAGINLWEDNHLT